jgi:hypothetical protein
MLVMSAACGAESGADEEEFDADATLAAIYQEETAQAQAAADSAPAEAEAETEAEEEAPEPEVTEPLPTKEPAIMPSDPPESERTLEDSDSSIKADENRTLSGDNILDNLYERPFTAREMIYQPELDIYTVDFAYEGDFFYFTITLNGMDLDSDTMYGIEFDRTKTGRGDLLVLTHHPGSEWSLENMLALTDSDGDVGGPQPIVADEGYEGNGYDTQVELVEDHLAFARISPDDPLVVQIAVSLALLEFPEEFLWGAWVDGGLQDFSMFDYNDAIGPGAAGSPLKDSDDYPIKALYSLDNTCRLPFGFEQESSTAPGTCINVAIPSGCNRYCVRPCPTGAGCCQWGCR